MSSRAPGEGFRHSRPSSARRAAALLVLPLVVGACDWFTDFKSQPSNRTWEAIAGDTVRQRANPQFSVPTTGVGVPAYVVSYQPFPATIDSLAGLPNPVPVSEASLMNGRILYQINCAVCHGLAGKGNGPLTVYGYPQINLTLPITQNRTDGYLYGMIRNGRGVMPTYNRIEELERWDVVNYVRALQGRVGIAVDTLPVGTPGQTGAALTGATITAPTRPAPYLLPDSVLRNVPPAARVPWLPAPTRPPAAGGTPAAVPMPAPGGER